MSKLTVQSYDVSQRLVYAVVNSGKYNYISKE
jgi:hypothetical protein